MHALTLREGTNYPIWFGGSYTEHWSDDYSLFVSYKDRRSVTARLTGESWVPAGGDTALCAAIVSAPRDGMIRRYFCAAAEVYAASQECLRRGIPLHRLYELFSFPDPVAAPELLRLLMDDCGFKIETAFNVTVRCCRAPLLSEEEIAALAALQPRTAFLCGVLRGAKENVLALEHDGSRREFRDPPRALRCGDSLRIAFRVLGGRVKDAALAIFGDSGREEHRMYRDGDTYSVTVRMSEKAEALWYSIRIETEKGVRFLCPDETQCCAELCERERGGFRLTVYRKDFETPAWFRHAIMYQIFPDRFAFSDDDTAQKGIAYHLSLGQRCELHGSLDEPLRWRARPGESGYAPDDFYGGTLRGIEEKLPYLKELGISCLYLNPIVEARSNHRYDASDYERVDPILGTNEDFEHLAAQAEACGIRIILDGVYSHTGADSVYFNRDGHYPSLGACQGKDSPYYKWYDFRSFPEVYRCWWGFRDLPEVNENDPSWQEKIVTGPQSVVRSWLHRGASGWRLDVADELPDAVLRLIRLASKEEKADAPIIGEVWEDAVIKESYGGRRDYALGNSLDSVMNYPFRTAVMDFLHRRCDARALRDFLRAQSMNYPGPMYYALMNLLGSHDVERLKSALATDLIVKSLPREEQLKIVFTPESLKQAVRLEKLGAALQFALPGVPCIYYGDEQGMEGVGDPFNRAPFREKDKDLHDYYVNLSALRRSDPVFAEGEAVFGASSGDVLTVLRYDAKKPDGSVYLTVINRGTEELFCADLGAVGMGVYRGKIGECSAETIRIR